MLLRCGDQHRRAGHVGAPHIAIADTVRRVHGHAPLPEPSFTSNPTREVA